MEIFLGILVFGIPAVLLGAAFIWFVDAVVMGVTRQVAPDAYAQWEADNAMKQQAKELAKLPTTNT